MTTSLNAIDESDSAAVQAAQTVEIAVRVAQIIEQLYGGGWAMDARGNFTYATPSSQTSIAMTLEDLNEPLGGGDFIGDDGWQRAVHSDDVDRASSSLRHALRPGEDWSIEYCMHRASGQYAWHRAAARPTRDEERQITEWYDTSHDIDVYKRTEAVLREREGGHACPALGRGAVQ